MHVEYVPLLQIQRELQGLPRNPERFCRYLHTLIPDRAVVEYPPLGAMNPMGREHVTVLLDSLLELDVDGVAARALVEASARLANEPGEYHLGLVVADDLMGGWTNRYDCEFKLRLGAGPAAPGNARPRWLKDDWLSAVLWSSEPASERAVREAVLTTVHRAAYLQRRGPARSLGDLMVQEGLVMTRSGCEGPTLDDEEIAYTREVLAPSLATTTDDRRTCIECLFGDAAARSLGFAPRGLGPWAGLALALHDARSET